MKRSMWLLTAAFLAGGVGASVASAQQGYYVQQGPATSVPAGSGGYSYAQPSEPSSGLFGLGIGRRLSNLFHRQRTPDAPTMTQPHTIYQSNEPPLAAPPSGPGPALAPVPAAVPPAGPGGAPGLMPISHREQQPAPAEIKKENVLSVAMADDGTWIIGELHYVHADGGLWVLRYAPLDKEDRYGGAVVLAKGHDMSKFREGDLVFVKGSILDEGRASKHVGGPLYRATSIELNERPGAQ